MPDRIAVVTGAGSGIGRSASLALTREGFAVALAGRHRNTLEETAGMAQGGKALAVPTDVSDPASVASLFERVKAEFGRVDVLFNNAGINVPTTNFGDMTWDQWRSVVDVNLNGMFLCANAAFRMMREQNPRGGRIINNGSISAHAPRPGSVAYTSTKHAVTGLTKSISLDGREFDIACGQIDIGNAATAMGGRMAKGVPQANGQIAVEAVMDVEDVGRSVAFMASMPPETNVQFITVMATKMPFVGRG
ncbi:MAG: SDR family oxidoreductase [Acetobacteraceae bacterium]|nr:SDR family oxidoreductase [Acetobacteraceae bacterium]